MLVLLPPSESKRDGGSGPPLDLAGLSFPGLTGARRQVLAQLRALSRNLTVAAAMLRLGPSSAAEAARNRVIATAPTLPSIDRYTGVLFDALGATSLPPTARAFAASHLAIASAVFGMTGALDPIPAYRLSADSRLPGGTLRSIWTGPLSTELAGTAGLLLDLRSQAYAALGPLPRRAEAVPVRVLTQGLDSVVRPVSHANKHGKGAFVRRLLLAGIDHPDRHSLLLWARSEGIDLRSGRDGVLDLVV